jgi:hypothetical protein
MRPYTKEIKEIIALGRKLDDLMFETYSLFAQRKDFDVRLTSFWQDMADWKKDHVKHWKKISKAYVFKNIFHRDKDDLRLIIKQLKSIKKRITQQDAVSQTILSEFCLVSDIFLEIFYTYDETVKDKESSCVEECETHLVRMANTLKPYLKSNPLYAVLLKSLVDLKHKYDFLLTTFGKVKKAAG